MTREEALAWAQGVVLAPPTLATRNIRPDVRREVDEYLALRDQIVTAMIQLRQCFLRRMSREGLTAAEYGMITEAVGRLD